MTDTPHAEQSQAVLIGTARYDHLHHIPAAAANIDDLADVLTGPGGAFTGGQCATVLDPDRDTLGSAVGRAARAATRLLLVYYAGHGLIDRRGRLHLTVPASDPDDIR
ncbi:caspase family protein [Nocardia stercoris]|uniref:caspase family protein n=1 Tax=Nocardia stercoris TaxID=2483361 RepID=UPI001F3F6582|nr:caspase family protein [Nocardia stercoris]